MEMTRLRYVTAVASVVFALAGSLDARTNGRALQPSPSPCRIQGERFDTAAFEHLQTMLTDTGDVGLHFASIRDTLGISGVRIENVVLITDTILCRRALNSWKAFYPSYGPDEAHNATQVTGGLLLRLAPNRYVLALAIFHPWTIATFFVTDSNFVMVKPWM
jgi:hypothetical protein